MPIWTIKPVAEGSLADDRLSDLYGFFFPNERRCHLKNANFHLLNHNDVFVHKILSSVWNQ